MKLTYENYIKCFIADVDCSGTTKNLTLLFFLLFTGVLNLVFGDNNTINNTRTNEKESELIDIDQQHLDQVNIYF